MFALTLVVSLEIIVSLDKLHRLSSEGHLANHSKVVLS